MTKTIEIIKQPRLTVLELIKDLSIEQLNIVPVGFNNNIIWNLGHLVATQQGISYRRAGVDTITSQEFNNTYGAGSKPERFITEAELSEIKELLFSTLDQFVIDYNKTLFNNYTAWTTKSGIDLTNIEDIIKFLPYHEGLHIGVISAQRRIVLNL
jgi:hypothetical protein